MIERGLLILEISLFKSERDQSSERQRVSQIREISARSSQAAEISQARQSTDDFGDQVSQVRRQRSVKREREDC